MVETDQVPAANRDAGSTADTGEHPSEAAEAGSADDRSSHGRNGSQVTSPTAKAGDETPRTPSGYRGSRLQERRWSGEQRGHKTGAASVGSDSLVLPRGSVRISHPTPLKQLHKEEATSVPESTKQPKTLKDVGGGDFEFSLRNLRRSISQKGMSSGATELWKSIRSSVSSSGFGSQMFSSTFRRRSDQVSEAESIEEWDAEYWTHVLKELQREKKRAMAREEQQYVNRSLYLLSSSSRLRNLMIKIVEWPWFNRFVLLLILLNCCFLVLDDPVCKCNDPAGCTEAEKYKQALYAQWSCDGYDRMAKLLNTSELLFTILFTLEMVIKILARGLILHKHAYLREAWNWLDFVVVVASLVSLLNTFANVQFLRTVRVLRPLRTMTRIKGMRPLINTFVRSFKALGNVLTLMSFFFVVYGILGLELLSGSLRGKCFVDPDGNPHLTSALRSRLESQQAPFLVEPTNLIGARKPDLSVCNPSVGCDPVVLDGVLLNTKCSRKSWCLDHWCETHWNDNPFPLGAGYVSFDNIGHAFLSIFQTLTLEAWSELLYMHGEGTNSWGSRLYHSSWVFIGAFFVVQLALAVLSDAFIQAQEEEETAKEREALHDQAILRRPNVTDRPERDRLGMMVEIARVAFSSIQSDQSRANRRGSRSKKTISSMVFFNIKDKACAALISVQRGLRVVVFSSYFQNFILLCIIANSITMALVFHDQAHYEGRICQRRCDLDASLPADAACRGPLFERRFVSDGQTNFCFHTNDDACQIHRDQDSCEAAMTSRGRHCVFFPDSHGGGTCEAELFTAQDFGFLPNGRQISLRHLCGMANTDCATMDEGREALLEAINLALTCVFIAELALKMLGMGVLPYFADAFNRLDAVIVFLSILELGLSSIYGSSSSSSVSALRGMRLFRLFKLARSWGSMRQILKTLAVSLASLGPLSIVWVMFMYIFALLGMQIFGGQFRFSKTNSPRSNFDHFFPGPTGHGAFVVTLQMISTENWNIIMYNAITSTQPFNPWLALVPIAVVVFGNYIIMNLFISILLQGFGADDAEEDEEFKHFDPDASPRLATKEVPAPGPSTEQPKVNSTKQAVKRLLGQRASAPIAAESTRIDSDGDGGNAGVGSSFFASVTKWRSMRGSKDGGGFKKPGYIRRESLDNFEQEVCMIFGRLRKVPLSDHRSLLLLSKRSWLRQHVSWLVHLRAFDFLILICIILTSVFLILESPDDRIVAKHCPAAPDILNCSNLPPGQTSQINCPRHASDEDFGRTYGPCGSPDAPPCCQIASRYRVFARVDQVLTVVFVVEMLLKIIADGFIFHPQAYLRNPWNWLDASIVVISVISSFFYNEGNKSLKALRAVRALRPLRVIKRNPGLKVAVVCLLYSIPSMLNVLVVVFLWFSMYAMLGVNFFKGALYDCYDPAQQLYYGADYLQAGSVYTPTLAMAGPEAVPTLVECVGARSGGVGVWQDKPFTFNSYPQALLALFEMSTTEGWLEVMQAVVDAVQPGVTPIPNFQPWWALYCAAHIILGNFVLLNLIVGSVINNYNKIKNVNDGITPFMTPEQQEWGETRRLISQLKPRQRQMGPKNQVRRLCFNVATHHYFEVTVTSVIILNVASMVMTHHNQTACFSTAMFWASAGFTFFFVLEAAVKLVGLGPRWYFLDRWNVFDFVVMVLSVGTVANEVYNGDYRCDVEGNENIDIPGLQILRAFRIARVFRLIRRAAGLQQMIQTLLVSLPSLGNIAGLLCIIIVIFAVLGITWFYNVNLDQDYFGRMSEAGSYTHFDRAVWLLHRQTTGEAWNGVMYYCSNADPYAACARAFMDFLQDGCGSPEQGIAFHVLWQLFGTYVMMQLFTAVILEAFSELAHANAAALPLAQLNEFVDVWTELDPHAHEAIPCDQLPDLIKRLTPPLGVRNAPGNTRLAMWQIIKDLDIPIRHGQIQYKETFVASVRRVLAMQVDEDDLRDEPENASLIFRGRHVTASQDYAARSVQSAFREYREKRLQVLKGASRPEEIPLFAFPQEVKPL